MSHSGGPRIFEGDFCSTKSCNQLKLSQKLIVKKTKKFINFYNPFSYLTNLTFLPFLHIISNRTTNIEYPDETVY